MAFDNRNNPPKSTTTSMESSHPIASMTSSSTGSTMFDSDEPVSLPHLNGSSRLSQVKSSELPSAEAYLTRVTEGCSTDDLENGRREGSGAKLDREKSSATRKEGDGKGLSGQGDNDDEEWTYPDGGKKAWSVIFGCFIFIGCQMGYGLTWGVLSQNLHEGYYKELPLSILNLVVGLQNFSMNGSCFVSGRLGDRYGYKPMIAIGAVCTFCSLVISAFVYKNLACLFIFQGVALGLSQGLGMPSYMAMGSGWFKKRRGLASGIAISGSGFGGAISSLIVRGVIPKLGYRNSLLVFAGINAGMCLLAYPLLEERREPLMAGEKRVAKNWLPKGIWHDPAFYSFMLCIAVGVFGYLTPYFYVTPYTTFRCPQIDPSSITLAVPLVVAEIFTGIGRVCAGMLADRIGPLNAFFLSFFLGGIIQIAIWPHAKDFASITVFAGLFGSVAACFLSILPAACAQLFGMKGLATLTGVAILFNAPGQFVGATLSGLVLSSAGYSSLAYYSGAVMLTGSLILLYARFSRMPKLFVKY